MRIEEMEKETNSLLEVGFLQSLPFKAKHHQVIVSDPKQAEAARQWYQGRAALLEEAWEKVLPSLGTFDLIFYHEDLGPLSQAPLEEGHLALNRGKEVVRKVQEAYPGLSSVRYSDQDLEALQARMDASSLKHLSRFFCELRYQRQITEAQHERMIETYGLGKEEIAPLPEVLSRQRSPLFALLQTCLSKHMLKGSLFLAPLTRGDSKYDDPRFFEHIIANPSYDYQERDGLMIIEKLT